LDLEEIEPILKLWEDLVDWFVLVENPDLECASRVVDWGARVVDRDFEVSQGCNDVAPAGIARSWFAVENCKRTAWLLSL
jgi:hypothetical protein